MNFTLARQSAGNILGVLAPLILVVLVAITYRDAPRNAFHLDDLQNIVRHQPVRVDELSVGNIVNAGRDALLPRRPLPSMTFAIDWSRGSGSPEPFQITNMGIHAVTAISVYFLLVLTLQHTGLSDRNARVASLIAAAIWACHPIQVQAVTYIVQRMTSLAALFTILTVIFYVLGRKADRVERSMILFFLAGLSWMAGLASKETAAIAPFLVLLVEYGVLRHGRTLVRRKTDVLLLSLPVVVAVALVLDIATAAGPLSHAFQPGYQHRDFTMAERLLTQPRVIGFHLGQILWPAPGRFSFEHDFELSTGILDPRSTLPALLALIAWCAIGVRQLFRSNSRIAGFCLLWVPATLVIESSIVPLEMVFEHRMYLPSVGLAGLAALGIAWLLERGAGWFRPAAFAGALVVALLAFASGYQVKVWRSDVSLARNSVEHAPNSARAWGTLAATLRNAGYRWDAVGSIVMRALELDPEQGAALNLKAIRLVETRRLEEAEQLVPLLLRKAERDHSVLNTLGLLRFEQGDYAAAVTYFERAVSNDKFMVEFRYNLALAYEYGGRCSEAYVTWLALLKSSVSDDLANRIRDRLARNYYSEGSRCDGRI